MATNPLDAMKALAFELDASLMDDEVADHAANNNENEGDAEDEGPQQSPPPLPSTHNVQRQSTLVREKPSKSAKKLKGIMQEGTELADPKGPRSRGIEIREPGDRKRKGEHARERPIKRAKENRELEVTAIPMSEDFLKQSYEEWKADPVKASVRVIAEVGHVHEMWVEDKLKDLKAQLDTALSKQHLAEQELASRDTALKAAKSTVERLREERAGMRKDRDDAVLKVVSLENTVKKLTEQEKEAAAKIKELEEKVANLKSKQGGSSTDPESEVSALKEKLAKVRAALKETHGNLKTAVAKAEGLYKVGFNEALSQIALRHPELVVDRAVVNEDNRAQGDQIIHIDPETKEQQIMHYSQGN